MLAVVAIIIIIVAIAANKIAELIIAALLQAKNNVYVIIYFHFIINMQIRKKSGDLTEQVVEEVEVMEESTYYWRT